MKKKQRAVVTFVIILIFLYGAYEGIPRIVVPRLIDKYVISFNDVYEIPIINNIPIRGDSLQTETEIDFRGLFLELPWTVLEKEKYNNTHNYSLNINNKIIVMNHEFLSYTQRNNDEIVTEGLLYPWQELVYHFYIPEIKEELFYYIKAVVKADPNRAGLTYSGKENIRTLFLVKDKSIYSPSGLRKVNLIKNDSYDAIYKEWEVSGKILGDILIYNKEKNELFGSYYSITFFDLTEEETVFILSKIRVSAD